jgi:hypothetical protein
VADVRRTLLKALADESERGMTQSAIANTIGVHRSVINRELRGIKDITLGRVGEIAYALGRKPVIHLVRQDVPFGSNAMPLVQYSTTTSSGATATKRILDDSKAA